MASGRAEKTMRLEVDRQIGMPLYVQLKEQIRGLITTGELEPGTQLPPADRLADSLSINRHTVLRAYNELEREAFVEVHNGLGTFVKERPEVGGESGDPHVVSLVDAAVDAALARGLTWDEILSLVSSRLRSSRRRIRLEPPVRVALFECNEDRLQYCSRTLRDALGIEVVPHLITELDGQLALSSDVDFAVTSFFHFVPVRRKMRGIPSLRNVDLFAIGVLPHLDVLRQLAALPPGSRVGVLYFEGPYFTEARLAAMVQHIEHAHLGNIEAVEPIYVRGELPAEKIRRYNALVVRPENLDEARGRLLGRDILLVEYRNVIDKASLALLESVVKEARTSKLRGRGGGD
mgnify:CR=1 FL=1